MAKETKAQRLVRFAAEEAERLEVAKATYTERMMAVLQRAVNENFELTVDGNQFLLLDRDDRRANSFTRDDRRANSLTVYPEWTVVSDIGLYELEMSVEFKEEASAELVRKEQARSAALSKLTKEEKELLGL